MSDNHIFNDLTKKSGNSHKLLYVLLVILQYLILSHEQGTNELKVQNRPKMGKFGCINIYHEILVMITLCKLKTI